MNYNITLKDAKPSGNRVFHILMGEELYNLFNEELKKEADKANYTKPKSNKEYSEQMKKYLKIK